MVSDLYTLLEKQNEELLELVKVELKAHSFFFSDSDRESDFNKHSTEYLSTRDLEESRECLLKAVRILKGFREYKKRI